MGEFIRRNETGRYCPDGDIVKDGCRDSESFEVMLSLSDSTSTSLSLYDEVVLARDEQGTGQKLTRSSLEIKRIGMNSFSLIR